MLQISGRLRAAVGGPDSALYMALQGLGLREGLAGVVNSGYPTLLNLVSIVSPDLTALPYFQLALHIVAVFSFLVGLQSVGVNGLLATMICGSLLFSELALGSSQFILTDGPGSSLAIMTVGFAMLVVGSRRRSVAWSGLTLALFLAYQIRPAYTFLLALVPILGVAIARLVLDEAAFKARGKRIALGLFASSLVPLLLFCSFRWAMIGQFGLVPSSGFMSIGVVGQFLDEGLVLQLPADLKPIASRALARRQELPHLHVASLLEMENRGQIEARHVATTLMFIDLVAPSYLELDREQGDRLSRLARKIIELRPRLYALQVAKEFRAGLKVSLFKHDVSVVMLLIILTVQVLAIVTGRRPGWSTVPPHLVGPDAVRAFSLMFLIAFSFCLSKLLLVVLILPPVERYLVAAGVFMPSLIAVLLAVVIRCLRVPEGHQITYGSS